MPEPVVCEFRLLLAGRMQQTTAPPANQEQPRELYGVSLRDMADFCLPLLWSGKWECIAFGAWYLQMYYYHHSPRVYLP